MCETIKLRTVLCDNCAISVELTLDDHLVGLKLQNSTIDILFRQGVHYKSNECTRRCSVHDWPKPKSKNDTHARVIFWTGIGDISCNSIRWSATSQETTTQQVSTQSRRNQSVLTHVTRIHARVIFWTRIRRLFCNSMRWSVPSQETIAQHASTHFDANTKRSGACDANN